MYIQRLSLPVRHNTEAELRRVISTELKRSQLDFRLLLPNFGFNEVMDLEIRFLTLADYETFWEKWATEADAKAFGKRFDLLRSPGGKRELWRVIDPLPRKITARKINRETMKAKPGCVEALIDLCLTERNAEPNIDMVRNLELLQAEFGEMDLVESDFPFNSREESEVGWREWFAYPRAKLFLEQLQDLTVPDGTNYLWDVVD
jgi:hypothetical protein